MQIALRFLNEHVDELGLDGNQADKFIVASQYTDQPSGQTHIYLRRTLGGLDVMNADISISRTARGEFIHVTRITGKVESWGHTTWLAQKTAIAESLTSPGQNESPFASDREFWMCCVY
ncbi:MAG TPA: hypothetical protein PLR25_18865 [Planctomycetaceae bacterium]|nr:hypothetical protein [Planctomycetaceae bacterium]